MIWGWWCRLPAGLGHSGHVAAMRGVAQADPAEAELAEVRPRSPAATAAVVAARLELRVAPLPDPLRCLCHQLSSLSLEVFCSVLRVALSRALASSALASPSPS